MFLAVKLLRVGVKQAKKHKATKTHQKNQSPWPEAPYHTNHTQPYPPDHHHTTNGPIPMPSSTFPTALPPQTPSHEPRPPKAYLEALLRVLQFTLGLVVIGLYGRDIKPSAPASDSRWVYAVVVGFLAALTAFVHLLLDLLLLKSRPLRHRPLARLLVLAWEAVLVVNLLTVFGIFAKLFLGKATENERMRRAVYVDVVVLVLWLASAGWMGLRWWRGRAVREDGGEKGVEM